MKSIESSIRCCTEAAQRSLFKSPDGQPRTTARLLSAYRSTRGVDGRSRVRHRVRSFDSSVGLRVALKRTMYEGERALTRAFVDRSGILSLPPVRLRTFTEIREGPAEQVSAESRPWTSADGCGRPTLDPVAGARGPAPDGSHLDRRDVRCEFHVGGKAVAQHAQVGEQRIALQRGDDAVRSSRPPRRRVTEATSWNSAVGPATAQRRTTR